MRKRTLITILTLPTLAVLVLGFFTLAGGGITLFCFFLAGIPAWVWLLLGVTGYGIGIRLLRTSRLRGRIALGVGLSMLPVLIVVLSYLFAEYDGP